MPGPDEWISWRPPSRWGAMSSSGELEPRDSSSAPPRTGRDGSRGRQGRRVPFSSAAPFPGLSSSLSRSAPHRPPSPGEGRRRGVRSSFVASRRRGRGPGLALANEEDWRELRPAFRGSSSSSVVFPGGVVARVSGGQRRSTGGWQKALGSRPPRAVLSTFPRVLLPGSSSCVRLVPPRAGGTLASNAGQLVQPPPQAFTSIRRLADAPFVVAPPWTTRSSQSVRGRRREVL